MTRPQRPSADATRNKILQAAKAVFLELGFDGAKTQRIAKLAGVHSNLVFHHFNNKQQLWQEVKAAIVGESVLAPPQYDISSAATYFKGLLDFRFKLYGNSEYARLMQWQQVTENHEALIGDSFTSPKSWIKDIQALQKAGKVKSTIKAKWIMLFIIYSSYPPFMQNIVAMTKADTENYKKMLVEMCVKQFASGADTKQVEEN